MVKPWVGESIRFHADFLVASHRSAVLRFRLRVPEVAPTWWLESVGSGHMRIGCIGSPLTDYSSQHDSTFACSSGSIPKCR